MEVVTCLSKTEFELTYELVMFVQSSVSGLAATYGGVCESWGVMYD